MPRVVVDVMPKPEILDPQGQAIAAALLTLGVSGVTSVRQGKRFELDVDGDESSALERARDLADRLLANPVIEDFQVRLEIGPREVDGP
ncbi:MAG: phosphoribosylformylglycinamidine synthase subunit PurS [Frankiaceae bacterium]